MADSSHQQTATTSVPSQEGDLKDLKELEQKADQLNANAGKFKKLSGELQDAMEHKRKTEANAEKLCLELAAYEDEFEELDEAGRERLAKCMYDIMQQTQDDPDIGQTDEFWESVREKLLAEVLQKDGQSDTHGSDDDSDEDMDTFDRLDKLPKEERDAILKEAAKKMYDDAKPYRREMAKAYLDEDDIKKLEADSDSEDKEDREDDVDTSKISNGYIGTGINDILPTNIPPTTEASASASKESKDDKDLDPETKSKMEQIEALQKLWDCADPKFCDMDALFKQTMGSISEIMTPDEAQTMTFAQKQEQRYKEFMRQVNVQLYTCKFKKVRISDETKSNIEYAKKDLEARGYPVSDVETLATSNDVDGQKQLFKHSINVTLVE